MIFALFRSFYQMVKHILFGRRLDILLYYPQHFNRSAKGSNPYFEPIIELCKDNGLKYLVMEEPDGGTSNPRDPLCMKADVFFWGVTIMRKLMRMICKGKTSVEIDKMIARYIDLVTFHKFRAKRYITISNSMIDILAELNPRGIVYDYQHGIIYDGHPGYFVDKDTFLPSYERPNRCVLLWGILYRQAFEDTLCKEELYERIKVVGYPMLTSVVDMEYQCREFIVISLQITSDSEVWYKHSAEMLYECLEQLKESGYKVLLKHHPRFNNEVDLSDIVTKYPFVEFTSKPLVKLVSHTLLHITWSSTTCFEYANYAVPTFFLVDDILPHGTTIFYEQYHYPLYKEMSLSEVMEHVADKQKYKEECEIVKGWYDSAYAPFDKQQMLKILTGNED